VRLTCPRYLSSKCPQVRRGKRGTSEIVKCWLLGLYSPLLGTREERENRECTSLVGLFIHTREEKKKGGVRRNTVLLYHSREMGGEREGEGGVRVRGRLGDTPLRENPRRRRAGRGRREKKRSRRPANTRSFDLPIVERKGKGKGEGRRNPKSFFLEHCLHDGRSGATTKRERKSHVESRFPFQQDRRTGKEGEKEKEKERKETEASKGRTASLFIPLLMP